MGNRAWPTKPARTLVLSEETASAVPEGHNTLQLGARRIVSGRSPARSDLKMEGAEIETEAGGPTRVPGLPPPQLGPLLWAIQASWQNVAPEHIPPIGGISKKATTKGSLAANHGATLRRSEVCDGTECLRSSSTGDPKDAAKYLGICESQVRSLVNSSRIADGIEDHDPA